LSGGLWDEGAYTPGSATGIQGWKEERKVTRKDGDFWVLPPEIQLIFNQEKGGLNQKTGEMRGEGMEEKIFPGLGCQRRGGGKFVGRDGVASEKFERLPQRSTVGIRKSQGSLEGS